MQNIASHTNNRLIITETDCFNPDDIFTCGQCFRFTKTADGHWYGVVGDNFINVANVGSGIEIWPVTTSEQAAALMDYFDMERDYPGISATLALSDEVMRKAAAAYRGIRILRQDPFETLISFIISQNNNIPRISKIIAALCREYGNQHPSPQGEYHTFPSAKAIADGGIERLAVIRAGFRAKYILAAAEAIVGGAIDLEALRGAPTDELIEALCALYGVGVKIASCVALFAYGRFDAFPIDVWVKRAMEQHYPGRSHREVFGTLAGIAQQYLFCYIRDQAKYPPRAVLATERN